MRKSKYLSCVVLSVMAAACVDEPESAPEPETEAARGPGAMAVFETAPAAPGCTPPQLVAASPGEEGQWTLVRLGPVAEDYRVSKVSFMLRKKGALTGDWCAGNAGPYKVRLFSGPNPTPVPLSLLRETVVAAGAVLPTQDYPVSVNIANRTPIYAGRYIYVGIEMVGDPETDTGYNCVAGCGPQTENVNWWSLLDGSPYNWQTFASVGLGQFDVGVRVEGHYL
jgi:hypothetical protein